MNEQRTKDRAPLFPSVVINMKSTKSWCARFSPHELFHTSKPAWVFKIVGQGVRWVRGPNEIPCSDDVDDIGDGQYKRECTTPRRAARFSYCPRPFLNLQYFKIISLHRRPKNRGCRKLTNTGAHHLRPPVTACDRLRLLRAGSGQWGGGGGGGGGGSSRPATQPPSHPATQPPCHLATQPSSHIALGLALLHFASLPLLSRLHDDDVSLQQVLVQFPCTYVCHVCVIR